MYGGNRDLPFSERQPVSLYAATKKANEEMAHTYSHFYGLPATGLRFFTVYGPWGRPDMAPMLFARAIRAGEPIRPPVGRRNGRLFNIGNAQPEALPDFIALLEQALGRQAIRPLEPMQPGDVEATAADTSALEAWVGFQPAPHLVHRPAPAAPARLVI